MCWMGSFSGIFFKAVGANGLLSTATFRIIQDRPDYKERLVKDSNFIVQARMLGFPFGWVFYSFDFSSRCWSSSPSVQHWMFWLFCHNTGVNCWFCASKHKWQPLNTCGAVSPIMYSQCISLTALSFFVVCFQAAYSKVFAPKRLYPSNLNKLDYRKVSWKLVFWTDSIALFFLQDK